METHSEIGPPGAQARRPPVSQCEAARAHPSAGEVAEEPATPAAGAAELDIVGPPAASPAAPGPRERRGEEQLAAGGPFRHPVLELERERCNLELMLETSAAHAAPCLKRLKCETQRPGDDAGYGQPGVPPTPWKRNCTSAPPPSPLKDASARELPALILEATATAGHDRRLGRGEIGAANVMLGALNAGHSPGQLVGVKTDRPAVSKRQRAAGR